MFFLCWVAAEKYVNVVCPRTPSECEVPGKDYLRIARVLLVASLVEGFWRNSTPHLVPRLMPKGDFQGMEEKFLSTELDAIFDCYVEGVPALN